jgi:hypothetical protein
MGRSLRLATWAGLTFAAGAALVALVCGAFRAALAQKPLRGRLLCPYGVGDAGARGRADTSADLAYDNDCETSSDCAMGVHYLNCCGTAIELGIHSSEVPRFTRAAGICGVQANCRCAGQGVFAEDGNAARDLTHLTDVRVACMGGVCVTHIVRDAGQAVQGGRPSDPTRETRSDCPLPSPADCSVPSACTPSACVCQRGMWACTPDCNGCPREPPAPVPTSSTPRPAPTPTVRRECDPPFTRDDAGLKNYKIDCL